MFRIRYKKSNDLGFLTNWESETAVLLGYRWQLKILELRHGGKRFIYVVNHNHLDRHGTPKVVIEMQLKRESDGSWSVELVVVDRAYQGEGLSTKLYKFLLKNLPDFVLRAGSAQSPGGRYIWYKLAQSRAVEIMGRKKWGRELVTMRPNHDTKEIYHPDFDCYGDIRDTIVYARAV
jgi:GNAT superfamily N-acetyltransferase